LGIGGELRLRCRLLDPDAGVGQVKCARHVLAGVAWELVADDEGLRKGRLLRLEIAVEELLAVKTFVVLKGSLL
jgi:hypothetical protein